MPQLSFSCNEQFCTLGLSLVIVCLKIREYKVVFVINYYPQHEFSCYGCNGSKFPLGIPFLLIKEEASRIICPNSSPIFIDQYFYVHVYKLDVESFYGSH